MHLAEDAEISETRITNYTVWVDKDETDDWGEMRDDVSPHKPFKPNRACVIVSRTPEDTFVKWMQVRSHSDLPMSWMYGGIHEITNSSWEVYPAWVHEVRQFAVDFVKSGGAR